MLCSFLRFLRDLSWFRTAESGREIVRRFRTAIDLPWAFRIERQSQKGRLKRRLAVARVRNGIRASQFETPLTLRQGGAWERQSVRASERQSVRVSECTAFRV